MAASPFGSVPGIVTGVGLGAAASAAISPLLEPAKQDAWKNNRYRIGSPEAIAALQAQGGIVLGDAHAFGARHGFSDQWIDALIYLAQHAPTIGEVRSLRRRGKLGDAELHHAYAKAQLAPEWWPALDVLVSDILSPGELAAAIHRGLVPNPGILLGEQPQPPFNVAAYPVQPIDPVAEALGSGYDKERLAVLVGLQGLPMGTHEAAQAFFRGILTHGDYVRAFNESNSRNEWAEAVLAQTRQIPTARDFLENALRGYRSIGEAIAGAELHGMSAEHATMIYQNQGRPMAVRLITQALARGGVFKPEPGEITDPYQASIVEGNLKPAYYDLAKSLRYTMPSAFTIRQLTQTGVWTEAKAAERLKWSGWFPQDADEAAKAWAQGSGSAAGKKETAANLRAEFEGYLLTEQQLRTALAALGYAPAEVDREVHLGDAARVKGYRDKALEALHKSYVGAQITSADATAYATQLHIDPAAIAELLTIWELEKLVTRKTLTAAQIRAAYRRNAITQAEAIADLEEHGYNAADAATFLAS
jgi:hypothetical protein